MQHGRTRVRRRTSNVVANGQQVQRDQADQQVLPQVGMKPGGQADPFARNEAHQRPGK